MAISGYRSRAGVVGNRSHAARLNMREGNRAMRREEKISTMSVRPTAYNDAIRMCGNKCIPQMIREGIVVFIVISVCENYNMALWSEMKQI